MIERFDFSDLRELFAKANEEKSGDQLAGVAARHHWLNLILGSMHATDRM